MLRPSSKKKKNPSFTGFLHTLHAILWSFYFPSGSDGKASVYNAGDLGSIPGSGRFSGEGNGNPLQYSCLENPMDGGACCRLLSRGLQRVGHDWATSLSLYFIRSRFLLSHRVERAKRIMWIMTKRCFLDKMNDQNYLGGIFLNADYQT